MFDLKGKVAIVTGGNGGIGLGMARGLAKAGASVVVAARNKEKSNAAARELQALGASAIAIDATRSDLLCGVLAWHAKETRDICLDDCRACRLANVIGGDLHPKEEKTLTSDLVRKQTQNERE